MIELTIGSTILNVILLFNNNILTNSMKAFDLPFAWEQNKTDVPMKSLHQSPK